jgi:stalled ribosome rescue protein Dom34
MILSSTGLKAGQPGGVRIKFTARSDYSRFGALIKRGDRIAATIRLKENSDALKAGSSVSFIPAVVSVAQVFCDGESVNVKGPFISDDAQKHGRTSLWLIDGTTFTLWKESWTPDAVEAMRPPAGPAAPAAAPDDSAALTGRVMTEFRELFETDPAWLVFGKEEIIFLVYEGVVKSLLITDDALAALPGANRKDLGSKSGKFRGATVIKLKAASEYHDEIQSLGGIAAILKFRFNPDDCVSKISHE